MIKKISKSLMIYLFLLAVGAGIWGLNVPGTTHAAEATHRLALVSDSQPYKGHGSVLQGWEYAYGGDYPSEQEWKPVYGLLNPTGREGHRFLWYRVHLPDDGSYSHILIQASELFEVFGAGQSLFRHGIIKEEGRSDYIGTPPRLIPIPKELQGEELTIRILSDGRNIGLLTEPRIGSLADLQMIYVKKHGIRFLMGCFFIMIGLIAWYPYMRLRQSHLLAFLGFSLSFGAYTVVRTTMVYFMWDNPKFWMYVELVTLISSLIHILVFTELLFEAGCLRVIRWLWWLHLAYGTIGIGLVVLGVSGVPELLRPYQYLILASIVAVIIRVGIRAYRGDKEAVVMVVGIGLLSLGGAMDIARQLYFLDAPISDVAYWGFFAFLISLIVVIIRRLIDMMARLTSTEKLSVAGQLAAGIAHEIRNPITVISGYLQLMRKDDQNKEMICIMQGEVNRISLLMNEFLFLAKPSEPKFAIHQMEDIMSDVIRLFHAEAAKSSVKVEYRCSQPLSLVECDDNQLKQVFINVIKNALEAMPQGGELAIELSEQPGWLTIIFSDTGCGIPESDLKRIGEPFYTTKETGNGLGVMICRRMIENHKGSFKLHSKPNTGTIVVIKLPLTQPKRGLVF